MKLGREQLAMACARCAHYNGFPKRVCEAGVNYSIFPGTPPCLDKFNRDGATCDKRRAVTPEEAQAEQDEHEAWSLKMNAALPIVAECKKITANDGANHHLRVCPICAAELLIQVSRHNLHARVQCKTPNCIFWIE